MLMTGKCMLFSYTPVKCDTDTVRPIDDSLVHYYMLDLPSNDGGLWMKEELVR